MSAEVKSGVIKLVDDVACELMVAQKELGEIKRRYAELGDTLWNRIEKIDDRLHSALEKLGN